MSTEMENKKNAHEVAAEIVKMMEDAGFDYDQMLEILAKAMQKLALIDLMNEDENK